MPPIHTGVVVTVDEIGGDRTGSRRTFRVRKAGWPVRLSDLAGCVGGINIDKVAPVLSSARTDPNAAGWNNGEVRVEWACTDALSGPASVSPTESFETEGRGQVAEGSCIDEAGNSVSGTVEDINIDTTAPDVQWTGGPADGGTYYFGDPCRRRPARRLMVCQGSSVRAP